jgi:hypothetical protein
VTGASRVTFHDLRIRADGPEYVVGRVDSGDFIAVPPIAVDAIGSLRDGLPVDAVRRGLQARHGRDINVAGFVDGLVEFGFVATVDGRRVPGPAVPRPTLPWLRARHVRWLVHPIVAGLTGALVAAGLAVLVRRPDTLPAYRDLLWTGHTSLVVVGNAVIGWTIVLLHELAHLLTARAYGTPGRITLGTRLQFLVAQTDVSGIWATARPARLAVYLSGIAVNLTVAAAALLVRAVAADGPVDRLAAAAVILALLPVPIQFLVFMRTDIYFLVQDLAGCRNLFRDGSAYLRRWARRLLRRPPSPADATVLPDRERRAVRAYALLLAVGTTSCLAVAATVTVPFALAVLVATTGRLVHADSVLTTLDAVVTIAVLGGFWTLWAHAWWRRHGTRIRRWSAAAAHGWTAAGRR